MGPVKRVTLRTLEDGDSHFTEWNRDFELSLMVEKHVSAYELLVGLMLNPDDPAVMEQLHLQNGGGPKGILEGILVLFPFIMS